MCVHLSRYKMYIFIITKTCSTHVFALFYHSVSSDQMEFEAAQKNEATQMNGKFDHNKYNEIYHAFIVLRSVCKTFF